MVFLENELMYGVAFDVSASEVADNADFTLPIGKAKIMRAGKVSSQFLDPRWYHFNKRFLR